MNTSYHEFNVVDVIFYFLKQLLIWQSPLYPNKHRVHGSKTCQELSFY